MTSLLIYLFLDVMGENLNEKQREADVILAKFYPFLSKYGDCFPENSKQVNEFCGYVCCVINGI